MLNMETLPSVAHCFVDEWFSFRLREGNGYLMKSKFIFKESCALITWSVGAFKVHRQSLSEPSALTFGSPR